MSMSPRHNSKKKSLVVPSSAMEYIVIVNENDEVIGSKGREAILPQDIFRVTALLLWNSEGQLLIAQRALTKSRGAGLWSPGAVAGTVAEGEDYGTNIVKEIQEEIGLTVALEDLTVGPKVFLAANAGTRRHFCQWYTYVLPSPEPKFVLQQEEVAQVAWVDPQQLREDILANPEKFIVTAPRWIDLFAPATSAER
jgi:isopentenyl-diphosphate delta-isomerase